MVKHIVIMGYGTADEAWQLGMIRSIESINPTIGTWMNLHEAWLAPSAMSAHNTSSNKQQATRRKQKAENTVQEAESRKLLDVIITYKTAQMRWWKTTKREPLLWHYVPSSIKCPNKHNTALVHVVHVLSKHNQYYTTSTEEANSLLILISSVMSNNVIISEKLFLIKRLPLRVYWWNSAWNKHTFGVDEWIGYRINQSIFSDLY